MQFKSSSECLLGGWILCAGLSLSITSVVVGLVLMIAMPSAITIRKLGKKVYYKSWKDHGRLLHISLNTWEHTASL